MSCVSLRKVQIPFDDFWSLKIKNCCWWFGSLNQIVHKSLSLKKKEEIHFLSFEYQIIFRCLLFSQNTNWVKLLGWVKEAYIRRLKRQRTQQRPSLVPVLATPVTHMSCSYIHVMADESMLYTIPCWAGVRRISHYSIGTTIFCADLQNSCKQEGNGEMVKFKTMLFIVYRKIHKQSLNRRTRCDLERRRKTKEGTMLQPQFSFPLENKESY